MEHERKAGRTKVRTTWNETMRTLAAVLVLVACVMATPASMRAERGAAAADLRPRAAEVGRELARNPANRAPLRGLLSNGVGDVMATLYFVFRESIVQQNEDKKYWITKLKMYNEIGAALGDYLAELNEAMREIEKGRGGSGGCSNAATQQKAQRVTATLEASLRRVETQIQKLDPVARRSAEVRGLQASLQRDRQLIGVARQEFSRAASLPPPPPEAGRPAPTIPHRAEPRPEAVAPPQQRDRRAAPEPGAQPEDEPTTPSRLRLPPRR